MTPDIWRHQRGFTLLELVVALAVFAVTALVVLENSSQSVRQQAALETKTLALWVAENRIAEQRLLPYWPSIGNNEEQITFADRQWFVSQNIENSGHKKLRKITVDVRAVANEQTPVISLIGYLKEPQL